MTPEAFLSPEAADRALLERLRHESDVVTQTPEPGFGEYFGYLIGRLKDFLQELLRSGVEQVGLADPDTQRRVAQFLLWSAVAAVVVVLVRLLIYFLRKPRPKTPVWTTPTRAQDSPPLDRRSAADWRGELDARLAAGDPLGALEALWWWLGTTLAGEALDPAWTSGQLVRYAARRELRTPMALLDRLRFGPAEPAVATVRQLAGDLEETLERTPQQTRGSAAAGVRS